MKRSVQKVLTNKRTQKLKNHKKIILLKLKNSQLILHLAEDRARIQREEVPADNNTPKIVVVTVALQAMPTYQILEKSTLLKLTPDQHFTVILSPDDNQAQFKSENDNDFAS